MGSPPSLMIFFVKEMKVYPLVSLLKRGSKMLVRSEKENQVASGLFLCFSSEVPQPAPMIPDLAPRSQRVAEEWLVCRPCWDVVGCL